MQINYDDMINNLNILHSNTISNMTDGLKFLIDSQCDGISYNRTREFLLSNIDVFERDNYGNYFYEYSLDRENDIIDNFNFESTNKNVKYNYIIGGYKYDINDINEFITIASQYSDFIIRITFLEKPNINDEIKMYYRVFLLETDLRNYFIKNAIKTKSILYSDGMCNRLEN